MYMLLFSLNGNIVSIDSYLEKARNKIKGCLIEIGLLLWL